MDKVTKYGRDWNALIPRGSIDWLMGRTHVCTPDAEIRADIRARATANGWTEELIEEACDYAIACMNDHRGLCADFRL